MHAEGDYMVIPFLDIRSTILKKLTTTNLNQETPISALKTYSLHVSMPFILCPLSNNPIPQTNLYKKEINRSLHS